MRHDIESSALHTIAVQYLPWIKRVRKRGSVAMRGSSTGSEGIYVSTYEERLLYSFDLLRLIFITGYKYLLLSIASGYSESSFSTFAQLLLALLNEPCLCEERGEESTLKNIMYRLSEEKTEAASLESSKAGAKHSELVFLEKVARSARYAMIYKRQESKQSKVLSAFTSYTKRVRR